MFRPPRHPLQPGRSSTPHRAGAAWRPRLIRGLLAATSSLVALTLATASATAQPAVTPAPLSIASIKNAMYLVPPSAPSDPGTIVQLQDGAYAEDADGVAVR